MTNSSMQIWEQWPLAITNHRHHQLNSLEAKEFSPRIYGEAKIVWTHMLLKIVQILLALYKMKFQIWK